MSNYEKMCTLFGLGPVFASESSSNAAVFTKNMYSLWMFDGSLFFAVDITLVETWLPYVEKCHVMFCLNAGRG
jgi:hypothetical protein